MNVGEHKHDDAEFRCAIEGLPRDSIPGTPEDNIYPDQANGGSYSVIKVRSLAIYTPPPQEGQDNKNSSVCSVNPPELRKTLHCGDDSVKEEDHAPDYPVPARPVFPQPKPYEIPSTNFH